MMPHQGALCRYDDDEGTEAGATYVIEIALEDEKSHELRFSSQDFDFVRKLFAILDTESRGVVDRSTVKEFVTLRCPVFWRRDEELRRVAAETSSSSSRTSAAQADNDQQESPTFDEVWKSVVESSKTPVMRLTEEDLMNVEFGVESWMVFCRFIALAQYLEAKRRFSARHLQQTMRHRNSPRGSEVVVVDVPPPEPPTPLSREQVAGYEQKSRTPLPLPELDLDHSLVAAHDSARRRVSSARSQGTVKVSLFGSSHSSSYHMSSSASGTSIADFKLAYSKNSESECSDASIAVRRSLEDMKWLNDTFTSHKVLGGTLCGRILPPFPGSNGKILASQFQSDANLLNSSIKNTTGGAIAAAAVGVGIIKDVAKTVWKNASAQIPLKQQHQKQSAAKKNKSKKKLPPSLSLALPESYYNPNSPVGKARQLERYLNYLLEHPALSTSFPLNTILKVGISEMLAILCYWCLLSYRYY
jgi:hypothetical protein